MDDSFTPLDQRETMAPEMGEPLLSTTIPMTEGAANTVRDGPIVVKRTKLSIKTRASLLVAHLLAFAEPRANVLLPLLQTQTIR